MQLDNTLKAGSQTMWFGVFSFDSYKIECNYSSPISDCCVDLW